MNYTVLRMTPTVFPFMAYALTSPSVAQVKLQNLATYQMVPLLSAVPGIARVQVQGGDTGEVEVDADPRRLAAYHLTLDDLTNALSAANTLQSVGRVEDHDQLYLLMAANEMHGLDDVKQTVLRAGPAGVVHLADVATVRMGVVPQFLGVDANGKRAVTLLLYQQPGTDMVAIARQVTQALAGFAPQIPPGVLEQMVRPERAGAGRGRLGARCDPHRHRAGRDRAAGVPAQLAHHAARHHHRPGLARGRRCWCSRCSA